MTISWAIYVVGSLLLAVHATLESPAIGLDGIFPGWRPWVFILFSGVMATALSNLVWNRAIARIGVARTAVFLYWVPVFGVGFAAMLLGERLNLWHLFGFLAVMGDRHELVPLLWTSGGAGGYVTSGAFERIAAEMLGRLSEALPVDAELEESGQPAKGTAG